MKVAGLVACVILTLTVAIERASANCTTMSISKIEPMVRSFLIRPLSLLERSPNGGSGLSSMIASVLAADERATLTAVVSLIGSANLDQKRALGAGISAAIDQCDRTRPDAARRIRQAVTVRADPIVNFAMAPVSDAILAPRDVTQPRKRGPEFNPSAVMPLPGVGAR